MCPSLQFTSWIVFVAYYFLAFLSLLIIITGALEHNAGCNKHAHDGSQSYWFYSVEHQQAAPANSTMSSVGLEDMVKAITIMYQWSAAALLEETEAKATEQLLEPITYPYQQQVQEPQTLEPGSGSGASLGAIKFILNATIAAAIVILLDAVIYLSAFRTPFGDEEENIVADNDDETLVS